MAFADVQSFVFALMSSLSPLGISNFTEFAISMFFNFSILFQRPITVPNSSHGGLGQLLRPVQVFL